MLDYIKIKTGKTSSVTFMLNYRCFEKLVMSGHSKGSESIREYFVKLREFIVENQQLIYQAMGNNFILKQYNGFESIYFIAIDKKNLI